MIRVVNAAASPLRYEMDPQGQYNALKAIEDDGEELLAIYHSHTKSAAYPSQTDVNQAVAWPDAGLPDRLARGRRRARRQGLLLKDLKIADAELDVTSKAAESHRRGAHGGGGGGRLATAGAAAAVAAAASWSRSPSPATRWRRR